MQQFNRMITSRRRRTDRIEGPDGVAAESGVAQSSSTGSVATGQSTSHEANTATWPVGLKILYDRPDAELDIVAVHGLNGHRETTFQTKDGVLWLRDLLPSQLPQTRIFTWGYDANTHSSNRVNTQYLYDVGKSLVGDLAMKRRITQSERRPIIFVAHSLGGIIVKSALIHSDSAKPNHLNHHRAIKVSTCGIFFLGTPHQGGTGVTWAEILVNVASVFKHTSTSFLRHLEQHSEWLQQQLGQYAGISGDFETKFGYEMYATPVAAGKSILVVPKWSAVVPGAVNSEEVAIAETHIDMAKYKGPNDRNYEIVAGHLILMSQNAVEKAAQNWELELQSQTSVAILQASAADTRLRLLLSTLEPIPELEGEKLDTVLRNLSFPGMFDRETGISNADPGTLLWVNDPLHPLRIWLREPSQIFWIQGKAGSGKSTLIKHVLQSITPSTKGHYAGCFAVGFYFNNLGSAMESSVDGMLKSVIYQILRQYPSFYLSIKQNYQIWHDNGFSSPRQYLKQMLVNLLENFAHSLRIYLLIDAFDECNDFSREDLVFLQDLSLKYNTTLHIGLASRSTAMLESQFGPFPGMVLQDFTSVDIKMYVASHLKVTKAQDSEVFKQLSNDIAKRANGIFLWVVLVVEELLLGFEEGDTLLEIQLRFAKIPARLDQYYGRMFKRISESHAHDAYLILNVVYHAERNLSLTEVRYALSFGGFDMFESRNELEKSPQFIRTDAEIEKRIRSRCVGFLEVFGQQIRFIHQSVRDFLAGNDGFAQLRAKVKDEPVIAGHQFLLQSSMRCLCLPEILGLRGDLANEHKFLPYATEFWLQHYLGAVDDGSLIWDEVCKFSSPKNAHFQNWYTLSIDWDDKTWHYENPNVFSFAAERAALLGLVRRLIEEGVDINVAGGEYGWPLQAAAVVGNTDMVKLLLDNGADIDAVGGRFGTAMAAAITFQRRGVIELLSKRNANIELAAPGSPPIHNKPEIFDSAAEAPSPRTFVYPWSRTHSPENDLDSQVTGGDKTITAPKEESTSSLRKAVSHLKHSLKSSSDALIYSQQEESPKSEERAQAKAALRRRSFL